MYNNHIMPQEDVGCACYSPSVFHAFPVVRRENTAVIKTQYRTNHWGMWKSGTHPLRWEEGENSNV